MHLDRRLPSYRRTVASAKRNKMMLSHPKHILLRNGTVLAHEGTHVKPLLSHDLLIEGTTIKKIGQGLELPSGGKEVDCTRKIISPGFVDTHHHLWQTQVRARDVVHRIARNR